MTVIATIITGTCTAHASDSFVTRKNDDGTYDVLECQATKIVKVEHLRGTMVYWGLSCHESGWSTLEWLREQAYHASRFSSAEDFANDLARRLDEELGRRTFKAPLEKGIGIHFTAYERVDGYTIPELFAITNFSSTKYEGLHPDGIHVTRETYGVAMKVDYRGPEHGEPAYRHEVRKFLDAGGVLLYNNGDPGMFNASFSGLRELIEIAQQRHILRPPTDPKDHRDIITLPIELVSKVQTKFVKQGYQVVGGKLHNLSITPQGVYDSDSGDR